MLLAQEWVANLGKTEKPANKVINLDMAKVYDRVSWFFPMKVLRKTNFLKMVVDIIWRLISNNYYLVIMIVNLMVSFTLLGE